MNAYVRKLLGELDERIDNVFAAFNDIKQKIAHGIYKCSFAPYENMLKCKVGLETCNCNTQCKSITIHNIIDECETVISSYYENEEIYYSDGETDDEIHEDNNYI